MKILLLKPINDVYYVIQPSLGLGYLATILLEKGHEVDILDSGKENSTWTEFEDIIKKEKYDIIGMQMFTQEISSINRHIEIINKHSPKTKIILGGPHISCVPEETLNMFPSLDFGFAGEAETGMAEFAQFDMNDLSKKENLSLIPGLVWRDGEKIVVNEKSRHENLDDIKFPAWHLMNPAEYPVAPHGSFCKEVPVAPIIVSRGCPSQCTYCAARLITGQKMRYRSVQNVMEEIALLHEKYKVKEIHIEDDNFTARRDYLIDFCNQLIALDLKISFALPNGVRLNTLDETMLKLMEKAGFYSMAVGIESGSDRILGLMKKNLTTKVIEEKIDLIKRSTNINITGFLMIGYLSETEQEILETIKFAKQLNIDKATFTVLMPLPGTQIWDVYKERNSNKIDWEKFFFYRVVDNISDIPAERLKKLQKKAMREFYFRPKIIFSLIGQIKTGSQIKIIFKRLLNLFLLKNK